MSVKNINVKSFIANKINNYKGACALQLQFILTGEIYSQHSPPNKHQE